MKKTDLEHEIEVLKKKNELLEIKLEKEEVWHSLDRAKLEHRIFELEKFKDKGDGTHAIGFALSPDYEEYTLEE